MLTDDVTGVISLESGHYITFYNTAMFNNTASIYTTGEIMLNGGSISGSSSSSAQDESVMLQKAGNAILTSVQLSQNKATQSILTVSNV